MEFIPNLAFFVVGILITAVGALLICRKLINSASQTVSVKAAPSLMRNTLPPLRSNDLFGNRRWHHFFKLDLSNRSKLSVREENGCLTNLDGAEADSSSMKPTLVSTSYSPRVWSSIK